MLIPSGSDDLLTASVVDPCLSAFAQAFHDRILGLPLRNLDVCDQDVFEKLQQSELFAGSRGAGDQQKPQVGTLRHDLRVPLFKGRNEDAVRHVLAFSRNRP